MPAVELPLSAVGLLSLADVAARFGCSVRAVQKWVEGGLLPVVVAGGGKRTVYLVRVKDAAGFTKPPRGRPVLTPARRPPSQPVRGYARRRPV